VSSKQRNIEGRVIAVLLRQFERLPSARTVTWRNGELYLGQGNSGFYSEGTNSPICRLDLEVLMAVSRSW
jgi:hypothetical protein